MARSGQSLPPLAHFMDQQHPNMPQQHSYPPSHLPDQPRPYNSTPPLASPLHGPMSNMVQGMMSPHPQSPVSPGNTRKSSYFPSGSGSGSVPGPRQYSGDSYPQQQHYQQPGYSQRPQQQPQHIHAQQQQQQQQQQQDQHSNSHRNSYQGPSPMNGVVSVDTPPPQFHHRQPSLSSPQDRPHYPPGRPPTPSHAAHASIGNHPSRVEAAQHPSQHPEHMYASHPPGPAPYSHQQPPVSHPQQQQQQQQQQQHHPHHPHQHQHQQHPQHQQQQHPYPQHHPHHHHNQPPQPPPQPHQQHPNGPPEQYDHGPANRYPNSYPPGHPSAQPNAQLPPGHGVPPHHAEVPPPGPPGRNQYDREALEARAHEERMNEPYGQGYGQGHPHPHLHPPQQGAGPYHGGSGGPGMPGGPVEDMGPGDARPPMPGPPRHMRQFSRDQPRPQSPHGPYVPAQSEHAQNTMPHMDHRDRGPPPQDYRPRDREHPPMGGVPFEGRPGPPTEQRPMHNVSPGQPGPGPYQEMPVPESRIQQHHRHPSLVHDGNAVPPPPYDDHRERLQKQYPPQEPYPQQQFDRPDPRHPGQRPPSSMESDARRPMNDPYFPHQPAHMEHDPRQLPFVAGHDRRDSHPHHPQQPPPIAVHRPDMNPSRPQGAADMDIAPPHPDRHRPSAMPPHDPQFRHSGPVGPSQHGPPQQGGYPPDGSYHPPPPPGHPAPGFNGELYRGPDGYLPEDQQRGKVPYPPSGAPQNWPGATSPRGAWDTAAAREEVNHRRTESLQDYPMRAMVDAKGAPRAEAEMAAYGSASRTLTPTLTMGRPGPGMGMPSGPGAQGMEMAGLPDLSSPPMSAGVKETPPGSTSPEGLPTTSQTKKRGRKAKNHGLSGSPGPQTSNVMMVDPSEPMTPKRGKARKRVDGDRESIGGGDRQWTVVTNLNYATPPHPHPDREKAQGMAEPPRHDVRMEGGPYMARGDMDRPVGDQGHQDIRYPDGGAAPLPKPGYEHQRHLSGQFMHPSAPYPHGHGPTEEMEYQQRLQQQQQQPSQPPPPSPSQQQHPIHEHPQQQQQQQQAPSQFQHSPPVHPPHPHGGQYNNAHFPRQHGPESMDGPSEYGAPRAGPGKAPAAPPRVAAAPGKEPEGLDTIAANTLVIFHQKGIQPNDPEDKRPRLESPHRRQESFSGHPQQHHMVAGEGGDMRGRGAPRNNLAQEAEALLILGRPHPQGDQKSQQQQQQQQQRHPHQPPPPQHEALPHPSYARAHGNPYPEQGQYDPPHGAMSRDAPHAGHMVQPHNGPYDPHAAHGRGVEDPDRFRRPGGFPTDAEDRNGFSRPPGAPFENGPPKQPYSQQFPSSAPMPLHFPPGQAHQRDQWPDAPLPGQEYAHGYQNGMSQDTPMHPVGTGMELGESGVVPPSGAPAAKPKATKPKPKPKAGVRIVSDHDRMEGPPEPLSSTSDRSHDSQQQFSPVQDQSGDSLAMALSTDRPPTTKTNRGKGRPKAVPPPQLRASSESLLHREAGGAVGGNFGHRSQETSPITERPRPFKSDEGMNDRGPLYNVNAGGHNISAFGSMILGSGMILVPPSEGSGQFPPTQLSIRTNRDHHHHHHHLGGGASSAAASGPSSAAVAAAGANESPSTLTSPSTPLPTNSVKKRRSRPLLEQDDRNLDGADTVPDSPKQPPSAKNRHAPRSPPPPTSLSRGKSNNRPRKGAVSTDADIERSNEITRTTGLPGGPSWLTSASNHATTSGGNNSSSGSNNNNNTGNGSNANASNANGLNRSTILMTGPIKTGGGDACNGTPGSSAAATAAAAAAARRPPMPPSNLSTETTNQRKRKRIKIEDKDERQGQRSSTISDMGGELEAGGMEMGSGSSSGSLVNKTGTANNSSKQRTGAAAEDGHDRDHDEDEAMEGEDEDETLEEGDRESGDVIGARKRRSPGDDDDDQGDDETGGAAGGSNGTNAHGGSNGQTRGSGGMGGRKHMKRKSNSDLSNGGTTKKLRDTTKVHSPDATKSTMSMSDHHVNGGTSKFGTNGSIKVEDGAAAAAAESDTEIEYLPMEDDPECPHMFGIDESDREKDSSSEDEAEEEEEDLVKTEGETGRVTAAPSSKKSNGGGGGGGGGQKGKESTEVQDDIQEKGRAWVSRLAMPESAWDESFQTYERVKRLKELKNRQPVRKRDAILAAILYIVCRNLSSPRTFSEICSASGVKRGDVGNYYRLMLKILEPSKSASATARDTDAEAFMTRWCDSLSLSPFLRKTAVQVFSSANHMNLTSGKCPSSVGAASIYLCIFAWNDARRAANCRRYKCSGCQCQGAAEHPLLVNDGLWIRKEPKDVAIAVGVVSATLMGCFRSLAPEMDKLLPPEFLTAAVEGL